MVGLRKGNPKQNAQPFLIERTMCSGRMQSNIPKSWVELAVSAHSVGFQALLASVASLSPLIWVESTTSRSERVISWRNWREAQKRKSCIWLSRSQSPVPDMSLNNPFKHLPVCTDSNKWEPGIIAVVNVQARSLVHTVEGNFVLKTFHPDDNYFWGDQYFARNPEMSAPTAESRRTRRVFSA
jgi:hypothetical protein